MKLPRRVLVVIACLAALAGALGLTAGLNADVTETDVINAGAALYVDETGGPRTDCVGLPGTDPVWIEVRCGAGGAAMVYYFDRTGARLELEREPSA